MCPDSVFFHFSISILSFSISPHKQSSSYFAGEKNSKTRKVHYQLSFAQYVAYIFKAGYPSTTLTSQWKISPCESEKARTYDIYFVFLSID